MLEKSQGSPALAVPREVGLPRFAAEASAAGMSVELGVERLAERSRSQCNSPCWISQGAGDLLRRLFLLSL